jgi:hypothetical protein
LFIFGSPRGRMPRSLAGETPAATFIMVCEGPGISIRFYLVLFDFGPTTNLQEGRKEALLNWQNETGGNDGPASASGATDKVFVFGNCLIISHFVQY